MMISELTAYLDVIEKVAGTRWLHAQVHLIRGADPRHEIGASPDDNGIHPLASVWFRAREELILSEITGNVSFSESTLHVANLGKNILTVIESDDFTAQKNRLLDKSLFYKAAFEIAIAAGYVRSGRRVSFTAPGLKIILPDGDVIVDCFLIKNGTCDDNSGPDKLFREELTQGESYTGPAIAYRQMAYEKYQTLRDLFQQSTEVTKTLLSGIAHNVVVITCPVTVTGPGGISLRVEGFSMMNPDPRFPLPDGFKIYFPYESSSIS